MTFRLPHLFFLLLILISSAAYCQDKNEPKLVQFSGVIVEGDSLKPVPFVSILIKGSNRGTISDFFGYFSFVAKENDVIEFSTMGYRKAVFTIPDSLSTSRYSLIQVLRKDTILLKETVIYPWPTKEQFKEAFLNLNIPDDDLERARKNLEREDMKLRAERVPMDGAMNQKYYQQQYNSRLYYAGQLPPNNLLNPIAWSKFIQAWKNGEFKRSDN
jgi:hypothetical protein